MKRTFPFYELDKIEVFHKIGMKLGRKIDKRVENAILMKTKELKMQKQSTTNVVKQLSHNKDTVRLHALKVIMKQPSKIEMALPLTSMLLDPFDGIRTFCIEEIHLFTPIRIFAPLIMRTIASGMVHIIPSLRLDMLKLLKLLSDQVQYQKYIEFDLFLPILMRMYSEQAKLPLKSHTLSCLVNIYNLKCTSTDTETLLRHLFVETPNGKVPNFQSMHKPDSLRILSAHWIETSSHVDMLNIVKTCLLYGFKMNEALILGKFPFTGTQYNELNIWISALYQNEDTEDWMKSNWVSMDGKDYSTLLPIFVEKYDVDLLIPGLDKLNWKTYDADSRRQLLSPFMKLDLGNYAVQLPKMLLMSVIRKDIQLMNIIAECLQRHLSKYQELRHDIYYRMRPMFSIKTKTMNRKGPLFELQKQDAGRIIDLLQFSSDQDLLLFQ